MSHYILLISFAFVLIFNNRPCRSEDDIEKPYICGPLKTLSQSDFDECEKIINTAGLSNCQYCFPEATWHQITANKPDKNDKKWSKHFLGNISTRIKKIQFEYKKHSEESKGVKLSKEQEKIAFNTFVHQMGQQISYDFFKKHNEKTNYSDIDQSVFNENPSLYLRLLQAEILDKKASNDNACEVEELKNGKIKYKGKTYVLEASIEATTGEVATEISSIADGPQTPKPNEEANSISDSGKESAGALTNKQ